MRTGAVDGEVRRAVQNLNGHDSAITRAVYVRTNRDREVELANKHFPIHFPESETAKDASRSPVVTDAETPHQIDPSDESPSHEATRLVYSTPTKTNVNMSSSPQGSDLGIDHPHKGENSKRVKWTTDELNYIKYWRVHNGRKRKVQDCLDEILSRATVRRMFHPHHIENASRLSHGWKRVEEEANKGETMSAPAENGVYEEEE